MPHNPHNLNTLQIDPTGKGYRLLDADEILTEGHTLEASNAPVVHVWTVQNKWGSYCTGHLSSATYRTLLSRSELQAARLATLQTPENALKS